MTDPEVGVEAPVHREPEGHPHPGAEHGHLLPGVLPSALVRPTTGRDAGRDDIGEIPRHRHDLGREGTARGGPVS